MPVRARSPRVVAAVLNWCRETETAECITSLLGDQSMQCDVLIVDNASPDGSGERLQARFPALHYLQTGGNFGYAGGNLRATDWALERGYDYVLVINDDAEVQPGCVRTLVEALERNPRAAAASPTVVHHGTSIIWFDGGRFAQFKAMGTHTNFGAALQSDEHRELVTREVSFLSGCVLLLRAQAIRECGGFRAEYFSYVEDLELSLRLRRASWALLHVPSATASHKVQFPPPPDSPLAVRLRDTNRRRMVAQHYAALWRLCFALWFYPTRLIHLGRYLLRPDRARARAIWRGMTDAV